MRDICHTFSLMMVVLIVSFPIPARLEIHPSPPFIPNTQKPDRIRISGLSIFENEPSPKSLVKKLKSKRHYNREYAANLLGNMGSRAGDAIPALLQTLHDPEWRVRASVVRALGKIGIDSDEVTTALLKASADPDTDVRMAAIVSMDLLRLDWETASEAISRRIEDEQWSVQLAAIRYVGKVGLPAKNTVPQLLHCLEANECEIREEAANSLGLIASNPEKAAEALILALKREKQETSSRKSRTIYFDYHSPFRELGRHARVRDAIGQALGRLGKNAAGALVKALNDENRYVRGYAADALGRIRHDSEDAIRELGDLLDDRDRDVRRAAARALGQIGGRAMPMLLLSIKDKDPAIRVEAAFALGIVGPRDARVLDALRGALNDGNIEVQRCAIGFLPQFGQSTVPELTWYLDGKHMLWKEAILALSKIGPEARQALPILHEMAQDEDTEVRMHAVRAIGKIGNNDETCLRTVTGYLDDPDRYVRRNAVNALGDMWDGEEEILEAIAARLKDPDAGVRLAAVDILLKGEDANIEVLPEITSALRGEHWRIAEKCLVLLRKIGAPAWRALDDLGFLLEKKDYSPRIAAAETASIIAGPLPSYADRMETAELEECISSLRRINGIMGEGDFFIQNCGEEKERISRSLHLLEEEYKKRPDAIRKRPSSWIALPVVGIFLVGIVFLVRGFIKQE